MSSVFLKGEPNQNPVDLFSCVIYASDVKK